MCDKPSNPSNGESAEEQELRQLADEGSELVASDQGQTVDLTGIVQPKANFQEMWNKIPNSNEYITMWGTSSVWVLVHEMMQGQVDMVPELEEFGRTHPTEFSDVKRFLQALASWGMVDCAHGILSSTGFSGELSPTIIAVANLERFVAVTGFSDEHHRRFIEMIADII